MKVTFLNGRTPKELRASYPNSMSLGKQFDESIIGVNEESQSIIYNLHNVIRLMIEEEYPEVDYSVDEDQWNDCYDEMNDRLCYGDGMYGFELLQDYMDGNTGYYNTDFPPYTFCWDINVLNNEGDVEFMEVELETDFEVE